MNQTIYNEVSIVIPTLGREILKKCLFSIKNAESLPREVIVVDQGQNQEVQHWLNELHSVGVSVQYVPSTQTGRASGVNRGIERVNTEFFAITDDDCLIDSNWIKNIWKELKGKENVVVTGRVEDVGDEPVGIVVSSMEKKVYSSPRLMFDSLSGGNMGASLAVMKKVGLLDEDPVIRNSEDGEWAYRALRAGVQIHYVPDIVIQHYGWRDFTKRRKQYTGYARSHGAFYGKYLRKGDGFIALRMCLHFLRCGYRCIRSFFAGNRERLVMSWCYLTGLGPGIVAGYRSHYHKEETHHES